MRVVALRGQEIERGAGSGICNREFSMDSHEDYSTNESLLD